MRYAGRHRGQLPRGSASPSSSRRSAASPPTPSTCATAPTSRRWRRSPPSCCPPTTSSPFCATLPTPGGCRARKARRALRRPGPRRADRRPADPRPGRRALPGECANDLRMRPPGNRGARRAGSGVAAERPADDADGVSLRDVIKAFYNYGVCRETLWPYAAGGEPGQLSVERARDAKSLSLGAYYRLRPNLNTYHAALHETGAVVVSAELHDGWLPERVRAKGEIVPPRPGQPPGTLDQEKHAFVVVGYTPEGFLVLNSWGRDWGGWAPKGAAADPRRRALALRGLGRHRDGRLGPQARRRRRRGLPVLDRRPGPRLPQRGIGPGDPGARHPRQLPPPRRRRLRRSGAFVSTRHTLEETRRLLESDAGSDKPYQGVLLTFAGGLVGLRGATDHVARYKRQVRDAGWYPFSVLWCVDYVEQSRAILEGVFAEATKRAAQRAARPGGRGNGARRRPAIWRDIARAAESSARPDGPLHDLARAGAALLAAAPASACGSSPNWKARSPSRRSSAPCAPPPSPARPPPSSPCSIGRPDRPAAFPRRIRRPRRRHRRRLGRGAPRPPPARPPAERPRREAARGLALRPLLLRPRRPRLPPRPHAAAPSPAKPASRHPPGGVGERWDGWRTAPRSDLVAIEWRRGRPPPAHGSLDQVRLVYQSDVSGRLKAILRRRTDQRALAPAIS